MVRSSFSPGTSTSPPGCTGRELFTNSTYARTSSLNRSLAWNASTAM